MIFQSISISRVITRRHPYGFRLLALDTHLVELLLDLAEVLLVQLELRGQLVDDVLLLVELVAEPLAQHRVFLLRPVSAKG